MTTDGSNGSRPARAIVERLTLTDPIHDGGRTITELEFGKPKARLYRLIDDLNQIGGEQILEVIADLCGISVDAVEELDWEDAEKAARIVGNLLAPKKKGRAPQPTSRRRRGGVSP